MIWECEICGYKHEDEELPYSCPVCAASKDKFSEWHESDPKDLKDESSEDIDYFNKDLYGDIEE